MLGYMLVDMVGRYGMVDMVMVVVIGRYGWLYGGRYGR